MDVAKDIVPDCFLTLARAEGKTTANPTQTSMQTG